MSHSPSALSSARVLIVDQWPESRRLLGSLLERDGAEVLQAGRSGPAVGLLNAHRPDLVVYDVCESDSVEERSSLATAADRNATPIVVVGTVKRSASPLPTNRFVAKPYHYRALIRRIEEVLEDDHRGSGALRHGALAERALA